MSEQTAPVENTNETTSTETNEAKPEAAKAAPKKGGSKKPTAAGTEGLKQGRYTVKVHPDQAIVIGVDTEHKRGEHELWDERSFWPLVPATIEFTATNGIMEPPELRYEDGIGLTVVDGRRRILHMRAANKLREKNGLPPITEVECFVENTPMSVSLIAHWAKNIHRENETLLSKCRKVQTALKSGVAVEAVMGIFGATSKATVEKWKKIANLPDEFQTLIEKYENGQTGGISAEAALAYHKAGKPAEAPPAEPPAPAAAPRGKGAKAVEPEPAAEEPAKGKKGGKKGKKKGIKASPKKGSAAAAAGKRGKKWFKNFVDLFGEYLDDDLKNGFRLGMLFAVQAVEDNELPKSLYAQVVGYKTILGEETNEEEAAMPAYMRKQIEKIQKKQVEEG